MSEEKLNNLCNARNVLCEFCENYDACGTCQVTLLIDQAYVECDKNDEDNE